MIGTPGGRKGCAAGDRTKEQRLDCISAWNRYSYIDGRGRAGEELSGCVVFFIEHLVDGELHESRLHQVIVGEYHRGQGILGLATNSAIPAPFGPVIKILPEIPTTCPAALIAVASLKYP
ncbi:hypothetical protein C8R32_10181 [Nitrosospira sp. Nsp5]|nr:hypothetical protein C8R32_10181 [Nitrosospira sp. Nsp5]